MDENARICFKQMGILVETSKSDFLSSVQRSLYILGAALGLRSQIKNVKHVVFAIRITFPGNVEGEILFSLWSARKQCPPVL